MKYPTIPCALRCPLIGFVVVAAAFAGAWVLWNRSPMPSITVLSPAADEEWVAGTIHRIAWESNGVPLGYRVSIAIRRIPPPPLPDEGQEFDPLVYVDLENSGVIDWTVSDMYPEGTYVLTVTAYESVPVTNPISGDSGEFRISHGPVIGGQKDAHGCILAAGYSWCEAKSSCLRPWETYCTAAEPKTVTFACAAGKTITATFYPTDDMFVDLVLTDGLMRSVPRALSASGARYATADGSFVFWNKGDTAFITENGAETFSDCVLRQ